MITVKLSAEDERHRKAAGCVSNPTAFDLGPGFKAIDYGFPGSLIVLDPVRKVSLAWWRLVTAGDG